MKSIGQGGTATAGGASAHPALHGPDAHQHHQQQMPRSGGHAAAAAAEAAAGHAGAPPAFSLPHDGGSFRLHSPPASAARGVTPRGAHLVAGLSAPAGGGTGAGVAVGASALAVRRQAALHALSAGQVLAVMDAQPRRDPKTGE